MNILEKINNFTRKKAIALVLSVAGFLFLCIIFCRLCFAGPDLSTLQGRESYLLQLGWQIDTASEESKTVLIPQSLSDVMERYNQIQLSQGMDLNRYLGEKCTQYMYQLTNYPDQSSLVYITLYVKDNQLIAADIHSTALNGFMHGITGES